MSGDAKREPPNVLHWETEEGRIYIETPGNLRLRRWEQLKQYFEIIKPTDEPPADPAPQPETPGPEAAKGEA